MKFVSIDIETTGLDPLSHQILEIGAVIGDFTTTPVEELPTFRNLIIHSEIVGNPKALLMNAKLIEEISNCLDPEDYKKFPTTLRQAYRNLKLWMIYHGIPIEKNTKVKFTAAGKNFTGFDLQFLRQDSSWDEEFSVHYRTFDPASLYFNREIDKVLPDLATCMERAGVPGTVTHSAVDDAMNVVKVLRNFYI